MNLGLGLDCHALTRENSQFGRQTGATHIVAHRVDYFNGTASRSKENQPMDSASGWGVMGDGEKLWNHEELLAMQKTIELEGLKLEATENSDPAQWHDVPLDGPKKATTAKTKYL